MVYPRCAMAHEKPNAVSRTHPGLVKTGENFHRKSPHFFMGKRLEHLWHLCFPVKIFPTNPSWPCAAWVVAMSWAARSCGTKKKAGPHWEVDWNRPMDRIWWVKNLENSRLSQTDGLRCWNSPVLWMNHDESVKLGAPKWSKTLCRWKTSSWDSNSWNSSGWRDNSSPVTLWLRDP